MTYASITVRDAQYAVFNLGYSAEQLLKNCPKAPAGYDPDPSIRRLKAVTTHPIGDYAVQPKEATLAAHGVTMTHYIDGGSYTVGATQNISMRATSMTRAFGGEALIDATVKEIIVENGRAVGVRVCNTSALTEVGGDYSQLRITEIRAKNIVCATSVYNLYNKLLPKDLPVVKKFQDPAQRSIRQSHGHVFLFCKIQGDADELGIPDHNLWYFNGYDMDGAFDAYFANPTEVRPPTAYIGFPCTKDASWKKRFPGISNCILISDGLYEWFEKWAGQPVHSRCADYMEFKDKLTKHLLDILHEFVPQVKGKVVDHHLGTPLTEVTYLASFRGGSYGTKCTPDMFAPINRKWTTTPHTEIKGLHLAGSDAFLPSVTGAMYGGCLGATSVLGHLGTLRLANALLCHCARRLQEDDPKLSWMEAYWRAAKNFTKSS
jgi:all-trans-retinol 13,14-reductase